MYERRFGGGLDPRGDEMKRWVLSAAVLGLLVAAGGAGAAAMIDSGDVKNNSLTGKDVKDKSLTKKDFRGSVRGPQGLRGATGPQGTQGVQGAAGATNVTVRVGAVASGVSTASCNPGERATGGGGFTEAAGGFLYNSSPEQGAGTPTAWTASAASAADATLDDPVDVQAYVICAAP
jgi:hypothetical protein